MNVVELACATDQRYLPHAATLIRSAGVSLGTQHLRAHVLYVSLPTRSLAKMQRLAESEGVEVIPHRVCDGRLDDLATSSQFPREIWLRLLLAELLPSAERVLYVDVDAIVLEDLVELSRIPLGDHLLAAVTNVPFAAAEGARAYPDGLNIEPSSYFSSGVMLMNLTQMRREDTATALLDTARAHPDLHWPDQSTLNLVAGDRRLELPPRWNATTAMVDFGLGEELFAPSDLRAARSRPAIRHFEGPRENKPWHYLCRRSHREIYLQHRKRTPWKRHRREGQNPRAMWTRLRGRTRGLVRQ